MSKKKRSSKKILTIKEALIHLKEGQFTVHQAIAFAYDMGQHFGFLYGSNVAIRKHLSKKDLYKMRMMTGPEKRKYLNQPTEARSGE